MLPAQPSAVVLCAPSVCLVPVLISSSTFYIFLGAGNGERGTMNHTGYIAIQATGSLNMPQAPDGAGPHTIALGWRLGVKRAIPQTEYF